MTNLSQHDQNEITSLLSFKSRLIKQQQQLEKHVANGADLINAHLEMRKNLKFWR